MTVSFAAIGQSQSEIENVVNTITIENTGEFFQWDGSPPPMVKQKPQ